MTYVDGYVLAVTTDQREVYKEFAETFAELFKEYGATSVVECWGDDVPDGKLTSFPMAVKRNDDETVVFSWVIWPSKEVRNQAWEKMKDDERMNPEGVVMPFDGKRMIYGGFEMLVNK